MSYFGLDPDEIEKAAARLPSGQAGDLAAEKAAAAPRPDYDFLSQSEGGQQQPYPPGLLRQPAPAQGNDPGAAVGITVGTGVDLGAHSVDDLRRWGVSEDAIGKLAPLMGLKGNAARARLENLPKNIGAADLVAMDEGARQDTVDAVQQAYDASNPPAPFAQLPEPFQTATVDLAYQYGPKLNLRAPNFWSDITTGNWNAAVGELRDFHDAYPARRNREADRMQLGIPAMPSPALVAPHGIPGPVPPVRPRPRTGGPAV